MDARVPPPKPEYLEFLSPYDPAIVALALSVRALVLEEAPESVELISDAYNAVASGYSIGRREWRRLIPTGSVPVCRPPR
jgi:hypothetical protein